MKIVALFLSLFVAVLAFASVAAAQCVDYASCAGQVAEGNARLKEYQRATAEVVATERAVIRAATSEARAVLATEAALSATATATSTPLPSATALPSLTSYPTPIATQTAIVSQIATSASGQSNGEWSTFRWIATLVGLPICAVMFFWAIARFRKVI